jgi:hypothetical protein
MSGKTIPRLEVLPPPQRRLWPLVQPATSLGFVLYGGTAIALRLGHRVSVDFDFFSHRPLDRQRIHAVMPALVQAEVLQDTPNTLTLSVPAPGNNDDRVMVSFFGDIPHGRVNEPDTTDEGELQVASLDDLLATKTKTILQRVEAKDYRDIAAMISAGTSLPRALAAARLFYGKAFQPSESLKAMVYFSGGDLHALSAAEKATLVHAASAVRDLPHVEIVSRHLTSSDAA